jgi:hypothetical protein
MSSSSSSQATDISDTLGLQARFEASEKDTTTTTTTTPATTTTTTTTEEGPARKKRRIAAALKADYYFKAFIEADAEAKALDKDDDDDDAIGAVDEDDDDTDEEEPKEETWVKLLRDMYDLMAKQKEKLVAMDNAWSDRSSIAREANVAEKAAMGEEKVAEKAVAMSLLLEGAVTAFDQ